MHLPEHFRQSDRAVALELIERYPFATLVGHALSPRISHLPIMAVESNDDEVRFAGHLARADPLAELVLDGAVLTAVFLGPHGYVSPTWYESPGLVPTWNFATVHVTGAAIPVIGREPLARLVEALADRFERHRDEPWVPDYAETMLDAIVGFELRAETLEAKFKLSQNRAVRDRAGVLASLECGDHGDRELAAYMRRFTSS